MYISPFICGVIATILVELGAITIGVVIGASKGRKAKGTNERGR